MTIAVTGGTGFVGQCLLDLAVQDGIPVQALARKPQPDRKGISWYAGDLRNTKALHRMVRGTEAVIHVAGVVNAADPAAFEAGNVAGTMAVVEAAVKAGVPRFVFVSSLSAREPGLSAYGASKARAEKVVMASGLDWTIVRPPWIYGPRDDAMLELFRAARWGVVPMPKDGRASMIHVQDLTRLLLALIPGGDDVTHKVFEPDDARVGGWQHRELAEAIGQAVGRRPKVLSLSPKLLQWAARADQRLRGAKAKLTLDRAGYMSHPDWCVSESLRPPAELWRPKIDTRSGLRATAQWCREAGWL
jgi:nucleoside-diphosphate-sugar epimerase